MWCTSCQQEVPAVAHGAKGRIACARCQQELTHNAPIVAAQISDHGIPLDEPVAAAAASQPPLRANDWQAKQRTRTLSRELRRPTVAPRLQPEPFPSGPRRFDPPRNLFDQIERVSAPAAQSPPTHLAPLKTAQPARADGGQLIAWLIVASGVIALAGGVGTIAWSLVQKQMTYWNEALGLTLGGQGLLIFGLVLVVSRLWRSSRYAAGKLQDVHTQLDQLQNAADALLTTRAGGAPAFYADLVRGASPQVLLANLKGQIDQLATHLGGGR